MFGVLVAYKQEHGDCLVPRSYKNKQLATWIKEQRTRKSRGRLEAVRIQRLEELGFSWDPIGDFWEEMFGALVAYKQQHGDCLVPDDYRDGDKQLGKWVGSQRELKKRGKLEAARIQRLGELEFSWDPRDESWEDMFGRLVAYKQQHGDCLVRRNYNDKQLVGWVTHQRSFKGKLEAARVQRLEELGFVFDPHGESWEAMLGKLVAYKQEHGDCLVQQRYSDKKLARWVCTQRGLKTKGKLESSRIQRLVDLGFSWDPFDEAWEEMFGTLVAYKKHHGDCLVPGSYENKQLATWVSEQRANKTEEKLEAARTRRLEELGFVWDGREASKARMTLAQRAQAQKRWEEMFGRLVAYKEQHGDCLVSITHSDKRLSGWVHHQRQFKKRGELDPARIQRLEGLGFVWDARHSPLKRKVSNLE